MQGRTFMLLTDMVVLRLLVRFSGQPLHYFGLLGIATFVLSSAVAFVAFVDTTDLTLVNYSTVVIPAVAVLGFCLSISFVMMGLLCELALRSRSAREIAYAPLFRLEEIG